MACGGDEGTPCEGYCETTCAVLSSCIQEKEHYSAAEFDSKFGPDYDGACVSSCISTTDYQKVSRESCDETEAEVESMSCLEVYIKFDVPKILAFAE
jgi:hypothetical protein